MTTTLNTPLTGDTLVKRAQVLADINKDNYDPKERSFEIHKSTSHEKKELRLLKREYKTFKGTSKHTQKRDELVKAIMDAGIPKWGNVSLSLI